LLLGGLVQGDFVMHACAQCALEDLLRGMGLVLLLLLAAEVDWKMPAALTGRKSS
jgi:hypothetical protein